MVTWGPRKRGVVAVPDAENAAGTLHAVHLFQRLDRPRQVLEQLVRVDHVKSRVVKAQRVHISNRELDVRPVAALTQFVSSSDHLALRVNADDPPGCHALGQVHRDSAGPAANIQQIQSRLERVEKVGCGVLGCSPGVSPQN